MIPTLPVQKTQNKLVKVSLISGLFAILAAALFHFFLYLFPGTLDDAIVKVFISTPILLGIFSIAIGMISLSRIMTNNIFGRGKAITGIVLGGVILVCLVIFLVLLF